MSCRKMRLHSPIQISSLFLACLFWMTASLLQAQVAVTVTSNGGDQSIDTLGAAALTINSQGAGTVTFNISSDQGPITLSQPLPSFANSVTFEGDNSTGNAVVVGQSGSAAKLFFQQNFTQADNLILENNSTTGIGLDASVTASSWTINTGNSINIWGGDGAETDATGGTGLIGFSGGNASVTVGDWTMNSIGAGVIRGGVGGTVDDTNGTGDQGGLGGSAGLSGNAMTLIGSNLSLLGWRGGGAQDSGTGAPTGGLGGSANLSFTTLTENNTSFFTLTGGQGGFGSTGGDGGLASVTVGSAFLNGSTLKIQGGLGWSGDEAGGVGGDASVSFGSLIEDNIGSQSSFTVLGGNGGAGSLSASNASNGGGAIVKGLNAGVTSSQFQISGGNGGSLGNGSSNNGGNGGDASVSLSSMTTDSGSFLSIAGGNGGNGGSQSAAGNGGLGGSASLNLDSLSLGNSVVLNLKGGSGGGGGDGATGGDGGDGGNASVTINDLSMGSGSVFGVSGGFAGNGGAGANGMAGTGSAVIGELDGTGTINLGGLNGGTLRLSDGSFSGDINAGMLIHDSGIFTFDGTAALSNGVSLSGGTLVLGDSGSPDAIVNGAMTIASGATLEGFGRANGTLTNSGTVDPGAGSASGFLTVTQYDQASSGELELFIAPGSGSSNGLIVSAGADLAGTLQVNPSSGSYGFRDRYDFLSGAPVTGTFDTFTDPAVSGMSATLLYGSDSVTLILLKSGVDFTAYAHNANELSVATALNASLLTCSDGFVAKMAELDGLSSGQSSSLDQMGGLIYTALPGALLDNLQLEDDLLFDHLGTGLAAGWGSIQASALGSYLSEEVSGPSAKKIGSSTPAQGFWLENTDSFGSTSPALGVGSFSKSNYGFVGGYDWNLSPKFVGGLLGGYLHSTVTPDGLADTAGISGIQFGIYGKGSSGLFDMSVVGGYVLDRFTINRFINIGTDSTQVSGAYNGGQIQAALRMDVRLTNSDTTFKPFWGIQYAHLSEDAFTETGSGSSGLELSLPDQSYDSLRPYAGLGETWTIKLGKDDRLVPGLHASVSQELMAKTPGFQSSFTGAPGEDFEIAGAPEDSTLFGAGASLGLSLGQNLRFFVGYEGRFNGTDNLNDISGGMTLGL